jgi:hypothetical protein
MIFQPAWRITRSLNVAAALMTCGIKVKPVTTLNDACPRSTTITEFHLMEDGHLPAAPIPAEDSRRIRERFNLHHEPPVPWTFETGVLRKHLEEDTLEQADPCHPLLDAYRGLQARECIRTYMERGTRYRLVVHPAKPRAAYAEGPETIRLAPGLPIWKTSDLALVSGMARIGCPVIGIEGTRPHQQFVLPRYGHTLPTRFGPEDAMEIANAHQDGELIKQCPEHPVVWVDAACKARLMLLRAIESPDSSARQVFMHLPSSSAWHRRRRSALVEERAPSVVMDNAIRHLKK